MAGGKGKQQAGNPDLTALREGIERLGRRVAEKVDAAEFQAQIAELGRRITAIEAEVATLGKAQRLMAYRPPAPLRPDEVREAISANYKARFRALAPYHLAGLQANDVFVANDRFQSVDQLVSHVQGGLRLAAA